MLYNIWVVSPPGYIYSHSFDEVAIGLQSGLKELGHEASISRGYRHPYPDGTIIVLGGHLLEGPSSIPLGSIIWNLEQIGSGSVFVNERYIRMLREFPVWDYSYQNIAELKKLGIDAKYCGIGYAPELTRIPEAEQDIDVLFYGSINERRMKICNELAKHCNVYVTYDKYGEERDELIARAKIVLNIHFYESKLFEIVRCSYLMANKKLIVSELGNDEERESSYAQVIVRNRYEYLVQTCLTLLNGDGASEARKGIAQEAFDVFSKMKQSDYLKAVLCV